jgi:uncharacterized membrane protein YbjE (DUF340 family)
LTTLKPVQQRYAKWLKLISIGFLIEWGTVGGFLADLSKSLHDLYVVVAWVLMLISTATNIGLLFYLDALQAENKAFHEKEAERIKFQEPSHPLKSFMD